MSKGRATTRGRRLFFALCLLQISLVGCGGELTDSPERFHQVLKTVAAHNDYENLMTLFTFQARSIILKERDRMGKQLAGVGLYTAELADSPIAERYHPDGQTINALERFGFESYRELTQAHPKDLFASWCEHRPEWRQRIERMALSRLTTVRTVGQDQAFLAVSDDDGTVQTVELLRSNGRWYGTEHWLLEGETK